MENGGNVSFSSPDTLAIPSIPTDITIAILSKLPVKSLLRFRCVCRAWCTLIDCKYFGEMHLDHAKRKQTPTFVVETDEELRFTDTKNMICHIRKGELSQDAPLRSIGSMNRNLSILSWCNGLCCLATFVSMAEPRSTQFYQIVNPITRRSTVLPKSSLHNPEICQIVHDPASGMYKLLVVESMGHRFRSEISNIGGDFSWRRLDGAYGCHRPYDKPFINGAIHWIFHPKFYTEAGHISESSPMLIVAFDVGQEKFRTISSPQCIYLDENLDFLAEFSGTLCLLHFNVTTHKLEFWVLKDYWNSVWIKDHSVECEFLHRAAGLSFMQTAHLGTVGDEQIVFLLRLKKQPDEEDEELFTPDSVLWQEFTVSYDPNHKIFRCINSRGREDQRSKLGLYIESLISAETVGAETFTDETYRWFFERFMSVE
ncbi:unnamed protein product [Victoria cruziana]